MTVNRVRSSNGAIRKGSSRDVPVVHSTTNYDQFGYLEANRPIDWNHVERLYDAINTNNMLATYPIVVNKDNMVMDGQHRLEAARALEVPIYYVVSNSVDVLDIAIANANSKSWTSTDYLHHYCKMGSKEYMKVRDYIDRYPFITVSSALGIMASYQTMSTHHSFRRGDYVVNRPRFAEKVAQAIESLKPYIDFYGQVKLQKAITNLMLNPSYEHSRFLAKMEYLSNRMTKCADTESYIELIEDIYNYNVIAKNRVHLKTLYGASTVNRWD